MTFGLIVLMGLVSDTVYTGLHTQKVYTQTGTSSLKFFYHLLMHTCICIFLRIHEQVAKSLVYALAGGSTCMIVRLVEPTCASCTVGSYASLSVCLSVQVGYSL